MKQTPPRRRQQGAALLLMLLLVVIVGLSLLFRNSGPAASPFARDQTTDDALQQAKAALIGYAATYRDFDHPDQVFGYLPCPDLDNDGDSNINCGAKDVTIVGRLPYKTLRLADLRDARGECLWYIVSGSHKNNPKTEVMNWDTRGHLRVQDIAGHVLADPLDDDGSAVAAIIAPGPTLAGQNRPGGALRCSGDATNSVAAYLDGRWDAATGTHSDYAQATVTSTAAPLVVVAGQADSATNNDRVVWITARELFVPIARRNDLLGRPALADTMPAKFAACLESRYPVPGLPGATGVADPPGLPVVWQANGATFKVSGASLANDYPKAAGLNCGFNASVQNHWENWKDQLRYAVCADQSRCIKVNGVDCRGVLLFAGRNANGRPRSAVEAADEGSFLEAPNHASFTGGGADYVGADVFAPATPAADLAFCIGS